MHVQLPYIYACTITIYIYDNSSFTFLFCKIDHVITGARAAKTQGSL